MLPTPPDSPGSNYKVNIDICENIDIFTTRIEYAAQIATHQTGNARHRDLAFAKPPCPHPSPPPPLNTPASSGVRVSRNKSPRMNFGGPEPVHCRSEVETLAERCKSTASVVAAEAAVLRADNEFSSTQMASVGRLVVAAAAASSAASRPGRFAGVEPCIVPQVTPAVNVSQARSNVASRHLAGGVVTSGAHVSGKQTLAFGLCLFVRVYKVNSPENT